MVKFKLDGIEVVTPDGWKELKTTIRRDDLFNAILVFQDGELEFTGDGYDYLLTKLEEDFCNVVELTVFDKCNTDDYTMILKGKIFITDCKFNERTCRVAVKVEDNSFYASINNNKNIKTSPFTDKTKNAESLTIATTYNLDIYSVSANTLVRSNAQAVTVYEAFRVLVDFMTDGRVTFESTTFGIGGEWEGLCITNGYQLRTATSATFGQFSFQDLFSEVSARIPIGMRIINPYTNPTLQIEARDIIYNTSVIHDFSNVYEVETTVDQNRLYSAISFKTGQTNGDLTLPFPEDITFFGFKEEEFFITGECNLDNPLELFNDWILSSNVIQAVVNGDQGSDSDFFLIDSTLVDASNGRTTNTDYLQTGSFYYNERLTNSQAAIRYIGFVPNSIASYLSVTGTGTFHAYLPSDINHTATVAPDNDDYNPLALSAEDFDVSGDYNTATYRFTAPDSGVFQFDTNILLEANGSGVGSATAYFQAYLRIFNSSGVIQNVGESFGGIVYGVRMFTATTFLTGVPYVGIGVGGSYNFTGTANVVMRQGDYAILRFSKVGTTGDIDYTIQSGVDTTYFKCLDNTLGGGVFQTGDPSTYPVLLHRFDYPISRGEFQSIVEGSSSLMTFNMEGRAVRKAWIKEIVFNEILGTASVQLITDKTTQNAS